MNLMTISLYESGDSEFYKVMVSDGETMTEVTDRYEVCPVDLPDGRQGMMILEKTEAAQSAAAEVIDPFGRPD
jgi:hypothetical protein